VRKYSINRSESARVMIGIGDMLAACFILILPLAAGLDQARSTTDRWVQNPKGGCGINRSPLIFCLVAGAGFEPATFGL